MAQKNVKGMLLALDWPSDALVEAFERFGLGGALRDLLWHIYHKRHFCGVDGISKSGDKGQMSVISQGCPLSPLLFVVLMSVVLADAFRELDPPCLPHTKKANFLFCFMPMTP